MKIREITIFTTIFLSFFKNIHATDISTTFSHKYRGCLPNSTCTKETGLLHQKWIDLLEKKDFKQLNKMINNAHYPFALWATQSTHKGKMTILWNSVCHSHKKKNIFLGKLFLGSAQKLIKIPLTSDKKQVLYFTDALLTEFENEKEITLYQIPRGESPTGISGSQLNFTLGEQALYYNLSISRNGKLHVSPLTNSNQPTYHEACPKELLLEYQNRWKDSSLESFHYCRSLFNNETMKYQNVLIISYCN